MNLETLINKKAELLKTLEQKITEPNFYNDQKKSKKVLQEIKRSKNLIDKWEKLKLSKDNLEKNQSLLNSETDAEILELANEETEELSQLVEKLETEIKIELLPRDESEDKDAIFEIRAGTGGDEASLFAADLARMYIKYAEQRGWKIEELESGSADAGGSKNIVFKISGDEVFHWLKYESGVHRVQRVPTTETQGRIHTSTATVAVLPEAEEVDIQLKPEELRIEACRAGGPGGQHVNTTDSAVQVLHIPTGIMVRCQDGRSQGKNKEKALSILRAKLLEKTIQEEAQKYSEHRKNLIGSGGREEKIRTYNFPQNRITDHRINKTIYNLDQAMEGELNQLIETLQTSEMNDRLSELMETAS